MRIGPTTYIHTVHTTVINIPELRGETLHVWPNCFWLANSRYKTANRPNYSSLASSYIQIASLTFEDLRTSGHWLYLLLGYTVYLITPLYLQRSHSFYVSINHGSFHRFQNRRGSRSSSSTPLRSCWVSGRNSGLSLGQTSRLWLGKSSWKVYD